jgi:molybdopterin/thiamine biosynthesis adenylyltransferase
MSRVADFARLASRRFLLIGVGGIGAPVALTLACAGARRLTLVDDDIVDIANLHRQILFTDGDIGRPKLTATAQALLAREGALEIEQHQGRALPSSVLELVRGADVVIDATDNFASRFLISDACIIAGVPVVHAAAVRWTGTALSVGSGGRACYRCLFEDIPEGEIPDCATAGIVGPVCGVVGAIAAEMAIAAALDEDRLTSRIATFDGLTDELRLVGVPSRPSCALCSEARTIHDLDESRYISPACAA